MNRRMVLNTIGKLLIFEAVLLLLPTVVSAVKNDWGDAKAFLISIGITAAVGLILFFAVRPRTYELFAKEGFMIAAGTWLGFSLFGALPFVFSGAIPNYFDAFFETVSGLTTTGATILDDVAISTGMQFWRCFTHWIGGMGVIVFLMAIIPEKSGRSIHVMRAEMPGITVEKLVPRVTKTAKILYLLYIGISVLEFLFLHIGGIFMKEGGMTAYQALIHTFSTAGTGGFSCFNDSCASFNSYTQWVLTAFMLLFGVNFNLYYFILLRKIGLVFKNSELRMYLSIVVGSTAAISISTLVHGAYASVSEAVRQSAFQVAAFTTTTGFVSNGEFGTTWPALAKAILFILLFVGGCAGSTGGGLKIARVLVLFKTIRKEFKHLLHPRSVNNVKIDGQPLDMSVVHSVSYYFVLYMMCIFATFLGISIFDGDRVFSETLITNLSAAISCFNNVGPAFGYLAKYSYSVYSPMSKIILSVAMLMGRLEIYPILLSVSAVLHRDNGKLRSNLRGSKLPERK